jgi:uncharacterized protein YybS (DUF2232 family)
MRTSLQAFLLSIISFSALALDEPSRTNSTTWEIYALVLLVFVAGFAWIFIQSKKQQQKDSEQRRARKTGS